MTASAEREPAVVSRFMVSGLWFFVSGCLVSGFLGFCVSVFLVIERTSVFSFISILCLFASYMKQSIMVS